MVRGARSARQLVVLAGLLVVACHSKQTIQRCQACFIDSPSQCATYEGNCYGSYSHAQSANTPDEAKEDAASMACTARYGGSGKTPPGCALGPSYTDADRRASLAGFTFQCTTFDKECP